MNVLFLDERVGVNRKGELLSGIRENELFEYKFALPVDCDEFLYVIVRGWRSSNAWLVFWEFLRLVKVKAQVFRIDEDVRNVPGNERGYLHPAQKGFLGKKALHSIDHGHHFREVEDAFSTRFGYAHLRNRSYLEQTRFSRQKLIDRVPAFDVTTLNNHRDFGHGGRHLVKEFLRTKDQYYASFPWPTFNLRSILRTKELPFSSIPTEQDDDTKNELDPVNIEWISRLFVGHKDELDFLREELRTTQFFLEFGTGGSTLLALNAGPKRIVSCETDAGYVDDFRPKHTSDFWNFSMIELRHLDVGVTKKWGYPVAPLRPSQTDDYFRVIEEHAEADAVFIDSRFRVAVAAKCYLHLGEDAKFLIHDFNRQHYSPVLEFLELEEQVGTLALLKKRPNSSDQAERIFRDHVTDAR